MSQQVPQSDLNLPIDTSPQPDYLQLERLAVEIRKIYNLLPQYNVQRSILCAGTNGEGGVCVLVCSVLRAGTPPLSLSSSDLRLPTPRLVSLNLPYFPDPVNALFPLHCNQLDYVAVAATVILTHVLSVVISRGIANVTWPGRLSFHMLEKSEPLVLVDGALNPASAECLSRYIHRLPRMVKRDAPTTIWISYILALSHSPPKTPSQTLSSILPPAQVDDSNVEIQFRFAALRFTPPEGMPWVKSVSPREI
ncbi:hypothetical protein L218DRAFT_1000120 [Marasmius fiardii PR-910]|nr:hypothetical protein L218DRAFT_1000120 [Marasmius fiardii PR-910]